MAIRHVELVDVDHRFLLSRVGNRSPGPRVFFCGPPTGRENFYRLLPRLRFLPFPRLPPLRITPFAIRIAAPSLSPRFNALSAMCDHWRFCFADRAFFVCRVASPGFHGMALPTSALTPGHPTNVVRALHFPAARLTLDSGCVPVGLDVCDSHD